MNHLFFSICIPQYNRTSFLIEVCRSLDRQTFRDFEVCISDDCSTDGREQELLDYLKHSGLVYSYQRQQRNQRYDGNLRSAISLAKGRYCFLLGNDDVLADDHTLAKVHAAMLREPLVGVIITNYAEFDGSRVYQRIPTTGIIGTGPYVAARNFRNFSFISGILLDREAAQRRTTDCWDGSEMYQMYIGCKMIAEGYSLLGLNQVTVRKDLQLDGEYVDSYARKAKTDTERRIVERQLPLNMLGRVVSDAIRPALPADTYRRLATHILIQIICFTYPYWLIEYRRVHSWQYALGVGLGMRPRYLTKDLDLSFMECVIIYGAYILATIGGLFVPIRLFQALQIRLYSLAKSR